MRTESRLDAARGVSIRDGHDDVANRSMGRPPRTLRLPVGATGGAGVPAFRFSAPQADQLSQAGSVALRLELPDAFMPESLQVSLDGVGVDDGLTLADGALVGTIADVPVGAHMLRADVVSEVDGTPTTLSAEVRFETIALENPDECEVLNNAECFLPYPSSRFLQPADTPTGFRLRFPAAGMPMQNDARLLPDPYNSLDGFSPTVQVLMHFPGGVDPVQSNAPRLFAETRTTDLRSLDADSPTAGCGEPF